MVEDGAFTIDEHRARTHHFDLRLLCEGSVASWAVAAVMPAPGDQPQMAVRIEELPGEVPARLNRTPWDHGRMTVRTWSEGESAVVTLHGAHDGRLGGTRTVSLLHVGSVGDDDDLWTVVGLEDML